MTRKATLQTWASRLGLPVPEDATAAQLEQAIESAISSPAAATPSHTLRDGIRANLSVLRQELPGTARAVLGQFRGQG
jgi:hypothetical protein